jgi:hypothetical protein
MMPNTHAGPSIDYRANFGYAIAVTNRSQNGVFFTACAPGSDCPPALGLGHPGPGVPARDRRLVRLGGHLSRR